ncbi:hypothetical protein L6R50_01515 [Myxococcota bacterium]|nr:hypothetical protein [Myxococcota bacterium]
MDSGDLFWKQATIPEAERGQRLAKAELIARAVGRERPTAMVAGEGDLAFGLDWVQRTAKAHGLPYVSANLHRADGGLVFPAHVVATSGGKRIGLFGLTSEALSLPGVRASDPVAAARGQVEALRGQGVDLVVAVSHLGSRRDEEVVGAVPGIDLVVGGHDRQQRTQPRFAGDTPMVQAGSRGKHLGKLVLSVVPGARGFVDGGAGARAQQQRERAEARIRGIEERLAAATDEDDRLRLERGLESARRRLEEVPDPPPPRPGVLRHRVAGSEIALSREVPDHAQVAGWVEALKARMPEAFVDDHGHGHGGEDGEPPRAGPAHGDFRGAGTCRSCHPTEFAQWSTTRHARAYASLVKDKRHTDFDCVRCHVTGWGEEGGPDHPQRVGAMRNVQCEACHGAAAGHVAEPTKVKPARVKIPEPVCKGCHDPSQDMGRFDYRTYLPKVDHSTRAAPARSAGAPAGGVTPNR